MNNMQNFANVISQNKKLSRKRSDLLKCFKKVIERIPFKYLVIIPIKIDTFKTLFYEALIWIDLI